MPKKKYLRSWINKVKEFQALSQEDRDKFCSYCGCEGGCDLCTNISNISELDIIEDKEN